MTVFVIMLYKTYIMYFIDIFFLVIDFMCVPCCWSAVPLVGSLLLACAFSQHSLFGGRSANAFSLIAWYLGFSTLVPNLFFSALAVTGESSVSQYFLKLLHSIL